MTDHPQLTADSPPLRPEPFDLYSRAPGGSVPRLLLRTRGGGLSPVDVQRWCSGADPVDEELLRRCRGPVLDVGCGPGRLVAALARRGTDVLGVDVAPAAGHLAEAAGARVLRASVFDPLPGEGGWATVILADGSVGIGGEPHLLLRRSRQLLHPCGLLLLETEATETDQRLIACWEDGDGRRGPWFPWARLGVAAALRAAERAGLRPREQWSLQGRRFLALTPTEGSGPAPARPALVPAAGGVAL
ncbi:methyltransferase domain-containing protein [Kitasatospora sp. NPDC094015]|uniref:class I SAM-dependent methyltransferase n=1 Tax=Kitasatospora sp. NPDC094015 TaxID=3155205 RepID=UPI00331F2A7C